MEGTYVIQSKVTPTALYILTLQNIQSSDTRLQIPRPRTFPYATLRGKEGGRVVRDGGRSVRTIASVVSAEL